MRGSSLLIALAGLLALSIGTASDALAQRRFGGGRTFAAGTIGFGPRFGRDFDRDGWTVGGQLRLPLGSRLEIIPSGDVFLGEGPDWQANLDAAISPGRVKVIYGGAGLAVIRSGDTDTGLNLFAGLQNPGIRIPVRSFVEARWTRNGSLTVFRVVGGVNFPLGGRR